MKGSKNTKKIKTDTKLLSTLFTEEDFHMDEDLALKVRDGTFLNNLNYEGLSKAQQATATKVAEYLGEFFTENVMKKSRRLSMSLQTKRKKPGSPNVESKIPVFQRPRRDSDLGQYDSCNDE